MNPSTMRVLVTGATGNVGSAVVRACDALGIPTRLAVRSPRPSSRDTVAFDFAALERWDAALDGCDAVFLLRPPAIADMKTTLCPFVDRAYARGVRHVVFLSVAGARSWVPHRRVEEHLEKRGSGWTILRPGFFAQNVEDAYRRDIVEDDRIYVPAGAGHVAFVDAHDLGEAAARVFLAAQTYDRRTLTLTGGESIDFGTLAGLLGRTCGRVIRYQPASVPGYLLHLSVRRKLPLAQAAIQTVLHVGLRRGDAATVDPTLAELLGRAPTRMETYVAREAAAWMRR